ncbi:MAG: carbohydrate binding family 9 domain-containing protein [bacterium]|nr:carbohydrate binding family 9 domain-containing protein [bacterium]
MDRALAILMLLFACGQAALHAQEEAIKTQMRILRIPRVSRPPTLDDFLNGVPREAELTVTDFRQFRPGDGEPVSQPTTAYLSYDDKNLYVAFVCIDDPKLIRARLAKHDQILSDDRTMVNLDTFHDHRNMYWFNVNPYGVQAEGTSTDGSGGSSTWDTLWHSEAKITEDGYIAMTIIPFRSIRFSSEKKQTWGLMLGRFITRHNEWVTWPYVSTRRPDFAKQGGDLEGFEDISPGRNIQLIPYGLFSRSRFLDTRPAAPPRFRTENETRAGLDAKVVLKDALTLDVALNPDFSQVESDEPQVTLNQRFEVFFPEKRPFFMDNASYFATPEQVFFSRRIIDPRLGARLTGKIGNWTIGALFADDRAPGELVAASDPFHGRRSPIGVARVQREFRRNSKNSTIGFMAASRDFASSHNRVYSVDTRLQLFSNWIFSGQAMNSDTRQTVGRRLEGPAYFAEWRHFGRHFVSTTRYRDRSPDFRSQLGFFNRVDIREASHTVGYRWRPKDSAIQSFGPNVTGLINYNRQGLVRDWSVRPEFDLRMTRSTTLTLFHERIFELFKNTGFRQHLSGFSFSSQWLKWFVVNGALSSGTGVNFRPGPGLEPFLGNRLLGSMGLTLRPGAHLRAETTYIYSGLSTSAESGLSGVAPGRRVFDNHIVRSNVKYQFSRFLSLRLITDYSAVLPNRTLMTTDKEKHVGFDALLTYQLHPGTALHIGYTDLYDNLRLDPSMNPELERTSFPDLNTGRQIFVKLSYLFRF